MKSMYLLRAILFCISTMGLATQPAWAIPDATAAIVSLKKTCPQSETNCFDNITALNEWLSLTRKPGGGNSQVPLRQTLVNIGPGIFSGVLALTCNTTDTIGYVTYKGAGRDVTIISSTGNGFSLTGCNSIAVQDMTIKSGNYSYGVSWIGKGNSNWTNVVIMGSLSAWRSIDANGSACTLDLGLNEGRHNFRSVSFSSSLAAGIDNRCGDIWIWGSEVRAVPGPYSNAVIGVNANGSNNQVHLYGSNVLVTNSANSTVASLIGLAGQLGGKIHFHGGEVVTRSFAPGASVIGALADGSGSHIHTIETSFGLQTTGNGTATRVATTTGGKVESVFQWPASGNPPRAANGAHLISLNGQDSYVENDCPKMSACLELPAPTDTYPHLMVYARDACIGTESYTGPWFDTVTKKCRGIM